MVGRGRRIIEAAPHQSLRSTDDSAFVHAPLDLVWCMQYRLGMRGPLRAVPQAMSRGEPCAATTRSKEVQRLHSDRSAPSAPTITDTRGEKPSGSHGWRMKGFPHQTVAALAMFALWMLVLPWLLVVLMCRQRGERDPSVN